MVRFRQRERFHATRKDLEPDFPEEDAASAPRIQLRKASRVGGKRILPRSVSLMVVLFIIVLMAILFLG